VTRVAVVDDQDLVRGGLVSLLRTSQDMEIVGEAGQGEEAVRMVSTTTPEVVLMDIRMPVMDGVEATRRIKADPANAGVRVVMLTTFGHDDYVFAALRAGASGFLLKDSTPEALLDAVRQTAAGQSLLSPSVTRSLVAAFATGRVNPATAAHNRQLPELTVRERDVLVAVATGLANAEIAHELGIGPATVKTYVSRLLMKLAVPDRVHLVIVAYEAGLM
jgi:DNA-binding NarL/FixJ family response regulator